MSRGRRIRRGAALGIVALLLAACNAAVEDVAAAPAGDDTVYGGFPVDPPAPDEVVLTVVGTRTVDFTLAELDGLADLEVTFVEPFVQIEQTFRAVRLAELLERAGVGADDVIDTVALNDYRFSDRAGALIAADALLAVARDGSPIPMNAGGPIRLVFARDSEYYTFLDAWNWSLRAIVVADAA